MPIISSTVILPNNSSILPHMDVIDEYLHKELLAGRMSGPFSREEVKLILRGPFQSSPLIITAQPQEPGTPDKLRICRHLSKATKFHASVNSHIRKEDFPTRFDMASKVADMVSISFIFVNPTTFLYDLLYTLLRFVRRVVFFFLAYCCLGYLHRGCVTWMSCPRRSTSCVFSSFLDMKYTSGVFRELAPLIISRYEIHLGCFQGVCSSHRTSCPKEHISSTHMSLPIML
jgi:hypothetical protein